MMKISAVVILYYPSTEAVKNIITYQGMVSQLIVIDNSETPDPQIIKELQQLPNVVVKCKHENTGISKALNEAASIAIESGHEWLLTMDQDSRFDDNSFVQYLNCIERVDDVSNIGMIGVNYENHKVVRDTCELAVSDLLITSGSVVNLAVFRTIGGFEEKLFIDEVDSEYCYRLRKNGYKVYKAQNIYLQHELGKMISVRNWFFGPVVQRNIHSPIRIYYMVRNFLYVYSKYKKDFRPELLKNLRVVLNRCKNALLYSKGNRVRVIIYFFSGVKDFILNRYGKKK